MVMLVAGYELYLIRHAIAEARGKAWPDDEERPLSEAGARLMRQAARGLVRLDVAFDVILASPFTRAWQTAELVAEAFDEPPPVVQATSLAPAGAFESVLHDLEKQVKKTRIALVGHEPSLGRLAAKLTGFRRPLAFKKGAVCRSDIKQIPPVSRGELRWFVTPKLLRVAGKR
jgi:phosphohistidine phosphatase